MKKTHQLISLGEVLSHKYAEVDANTIKPQIQKSIWEDIKNAAALGPQGQGIMNFPQMIQEDGTTIRFDVFRNDTLGMAKIKIYNFGVSKPENAPKYQALPNQVEAYLNKYPELFQFKLNGDNVVYKDFILNLSYEPIFEAGKPIAGN